MVRCIPMAIVPIELLATSCDIATGAGSRCANVYTNSLSQLAQPSAGDSKWVQHVKKLSARKHFRPPIPYSSKEKQ
eukprot:2324920-Amphidinium_carterae.1